ncbi:MAG: HypC/HybG/HupF family hydrogenase formation chaperone [Gemmatimonadales bacterium]
MPADRCPPEHCALCGDEALLALVLSVDGARQSADVQLDGGVRTVALDLIAEVEPGDAVLVHQGFAIGRMERG